MMSGLGTSTLCGRVLSDMALLPDGPRQIGRRVPVACSLSLPPNVPFLSAELDSLAAVRRGRYVAPAGLRAAHRVVAACQAGNWSSYFALAWRLGWFLIGR